jgi:hypothetical protein
LLEALAPVSLKTANGNSTLTIAFHHGSALAFRVLTHNRVRARESKKFCLGRGTLGAADRRATAGKPVFDMGRRELVGLLLVARRRGCLRRVRSRLSGRGGFH